VPDIGWTVVFSVPSATSDAALWRHLLGLAAAEILVFLAAAWAAILVSRKAANAVERAAEQASDVAEGWHPDLPRTGIEELDRLAQALEDAASKLSSEARQRALAESERDELLALEKTARSAAEAANRSKDEFLAMLGHELRNPLGAVSNAVQLLQQDKAGPEQIAFARGVITRQTGHLARLIDELLDVGRLVTGKIYLQREPMDLAAAVRNALDALKAAGKLDAHKLSLDVSPAWIEGDRTRIEQVVTNLVSNSLAYTPAGGAIALSVRREGDDAVMSVEDSGIGMAPDELERVFDLFFQGKSEAHRKGGLGLGLTLVHRLVELHGGIVSAQSVGPGTGAAFTVRLPAVEPLRESKHPSAGRARAAQPRAILIIEDNQDFRDALKRVLEGDGHTVYAAADGNAGLEAFEQVKPDVALIDIGLPGIDGYEIARAIRAKHGNSIRLIALTGYGQSKDERRAAQAGFDAHLVKLADIEKLRTLIGGDVG
jgi:signal transduction histidine kinase